MFISHDFLICHFCKVYLLDANNFHQRINGWLRQQLKFVIGLFIKQTKNNNLIQIS